MLTTLEAAKKLKISVQTVRKLIHTKQLPAVRVGRHFRIEIASVASFLQRSAV